jgi:hypothetical protein
MFGINPSFHKFLITQSGGALAEGETEFDARKPSCKETREALLRQHYDNENHSGFTKTREPLARQYFWPDLAKYVDKYIKACTSCIRNKSTMQAPLGFLHPLPIPTERFSDIAMDFVAPYPNQVGSIHCLSSQID